MKHPMVILEIDAGRLKVVLDPCDAYNLAHALIMGSMRAQREQINVWVGLKPAEPAEETRDGERGTRDPVPQEPEADRDSDTAD